MSDLGITGVVCFGMFQVESVFGFPMFDLEITNCDVICNLLSESVLAICMSNSTVKNSGV
jgi:hypothetical protein